MCVSMQAHLLRAVRFYVVGPVRRPSESRTCTMPRRLALARTTAKKQDSSKIRNNTIIMSSTKHSAYRQPTYVAAVARCCTTCGSGTEEQSGAPVRAIAINSCLFVCRRAIFPRCVFAEAMPLVSIREEPRFKRKALVDGRLARLFWHHDCLLRVAEL